MPDFEGTSAACVDITLASTRIYKPLSSRPHSHSLSYPSDVMLLRLLPFLQLLSYVVLYSSPVLASSFNVSTHGQASNTMNIGVETLGNALVGPSTYPLSYPVDTAS